jgi:signal peptidase I
MDRHKLKKHKETVKKHAKKAWWFIWEDDSWASWFVNIVLAFVIIKFLVYPGLGAALHTSHPIVAVVSGSMEHDGSFDDWWSSSAMCEDTACAQSEFYSSRGIEKETFQDFRFHNGFNKGDIMILYRTKPSKVEVGDVIVFMADRPDPIIHRVISSKKDAGAFVFSTKGDHNQGSFYFESSIRESDYIGRAVVRIPFLGYIKIGFVKLLSLTGMA